MGTMSWRARARRALLFSQGPPAARAAAWSRVPVTQPRARVCARVSGPTLVDSARALAAAREPVEAEASALRLQRRVSSSTPASLRPICASSRSMRPESRRAMAVWLRESKGVVTAGGSAGATATTTDGGDCSSERGTAGNAATAATPATGASRSAAPRRSTARSARACESGSRGACSRCPVSGGSVRRWGKGSAGGQSTDVTISSIE